MKRSLLIALVASAVLTAPASAAEVEVRLVEAQHHFTNSRASEWRAVFLAAPGERNDVRVSAVWQGPVRFHDPSAPVRAGDGCRSLDEHIAECSLTEEQSRSPKVMSPYLSFADVRAGDEDDVVRITSDVPAPALIADGGAGDDTLTGGETADALDGGGGGRDRLFGLDGGDLLSDGDVSGRADTDLLDGGRAENDTVSYAGRTRDLRIDLADRVGDGERGERDRLRGIEGVTGGAGDDDIGGDHWGSLLEGGPGDDHLDGEAGSDSLFGGPGDDRLHGHADPDGFTGGSGRDQLRGDVNQDFFYDASSHDNVSCGARKDVLYNPRNLLVRADCEQLILNFRGDGTLVKLGGREMRIDAHPKRSASGGSLRFVLNCPIDGSGEACRRAQGKLSLFSTSGVPLGSVRFASVVTVPLNAAGRRVVAAGGVLGVRLRGRGLPDVRWRVRAR